MLKVLLLNQFKELAKARRVIGDSLWGLEYGE